MDAQEDTVGSAVKVKKTDSRGKDEGSVEISIPDKEAILVRSLLNYDAPHYFARFTVYGCPPGLEILEKYENLVVNRRLQNFIDIEQEDQQLLAYSQFDVKNSRGLQLYIAIEKVTKRSLRWVRDARLFEVSFFDFHCRKVFTVKRSCGLKFGLAQYLCLFCTAGFNGCGNVAEVINGADGSPLGSVRQKLSFSSTVFHIYNRKGKCIMIVDGIEEDGILDVTFPGDEEPIAMIETLMNDAEAFDFYRVVVPKYSVPYGITFFKNFITPEQKALLLATIILLDFIALRPTGDYPHLAEVIPDDFQDFPMPHSKLRRDESKELVILTERKHRKYITRSRLRGRWGCCIWCCRLLCIFWFLGMKRNAVRCIGLLFVAVLAVVALIIFVKIAINRL